MMWWERLILRQPARAAWWITGIAIAAALWAGRTPAPASTLDWMLWWVFTCIYVLRLAAMGVLDRLTKKYAFPAADLRAFRRRAWIPGLLLSMMFFVSILGVPFQILFPISRPALDRLAHLQLASAGPTASYVTTQQQVGIYQTTAISSEDGVVTVFIRGGMLIYHPAGRHPVFERRPYPKLRKHLGGDWYSP